MANPNYKATYEGTTVWVRERVTRGSAAGGTLAGVHWHKLHQTTPAGDKTKCGTLFTGETVRRSVTPNDGAKLCPKCFQRQAI